MNICRLRVGMFLLMVWISSPFSPLTVLIFRLMLLRISLLAPLCFFLPSGPLPLLFLVLQLSFRLLFLLLLLFSSAVSSPGGVSSGLPWGSVAVPVSSAGLLSSFPSGSASLSGPPPLLAQSLPSSSLLPPSLSLAGGPLGLAAVADPVPSAAPAYAQAGSSSLFRPFDAPSAGPSSVVTPALPLLGSAPLAGVPPPPAAPLGSSFSWAAPGPSFAPSHPAPSLPDDSAFDPDFADPSALGPEPPLAPTVPDSVHAEIRRMYAYVVDLFPQAAGSPAATPPPRALFEDFFVASPSSTHLPVFLDWFARVRTSLSEADARLASLLASGRPDSSLLPQRMSQYAVHGDCASSAAVPVNPSLLSMFERSLCPSLQLGISLREVALMESSSRFHSEALFHSLWLLSVLFAFVRLQGFSPADASLFNTLVTSLCKCLAHQSSISASFTAFLVVTLHSLNT